MCAIEDALIGKRNFYSIDWGGIRYSGVYEVADIEFGPPTHLDQNLDPKWLTKLHILVILLSYYE